MLIQQWSGVVCIDPTLGQFFYNSVGLSMSTVPPLSRQHSTAKN